MNPPPLAPSARKVLEHLRGADPMTGKQLRESTGLPRRTMYTALCVLRELGLVRERPNLHDTRQTYFWAAE